MYLHQQLLLYWHPRCFCYAEIKLRPLTIRVTRVLILKSVRPGRPYKLITGISPVAAANLGSTMPSLLN